MEGGLLSLKWNNHRSSFIHVLSSLRKKDSFCDVTLACEGKFYPSHKLVLSTCSEYFQDMFQHTQCKHPVIVLKDIHCEDLEALLNYMYLGEVNVLQEKLSTLIKAAECLKIKGLAVPDDPPKDAIGEKRSSGLDSAPDSKRRRTDTSKPFSKNLSKSTEHSYRPSTTSQDNNYSLNRSSDNEMTENYSFDNENSSTPIKNKGRESNFIKQEPPDTYPEAEDTKEGVLQSAHNSFMSPLPQDEASNTDVMGPSESQEIWGSESRSGDGYPSLDGGGDGGGEATNEDGTRNETIWNDTPWPTPVAPLADVRIPCRKPSWGFEDSSLFTCHICPYKSQKRADVLKHSRTHTGEKPYRCKWCTYSTAQTSNILKHMRSMHPKQIQEEQGK